VPLSTLGVYLAGGEWKVTATVALAHACGVSVEWLTTGNEHQTPGHPVAEPPSTEISQKGLFETVDIIQLARAFEFVEGALDRRNATLPTIERARAIVLAYDLLQMERLTDHSGIKS
jgi:hypothetical protein